MNNILDIIDQRFVPPVAGIDLEHALSYVAADEIPLAWFYRNFTVPRTFYRKGSRLVLEEFLESRECLAADPRERAFRVIRAVSETIRHFSRLGVAGPPDRALSEEGLLQSREGWCNEQARVLAVLSQIAGVPARLVFGAMPNAQGHVLTELFLEGKWVLVDQTADFVFTDAQGNLLSLPEFAPKGPVHEAMSVRYKSALHEDREKACDAAFWDQYVPYGVISDPLDLFFRLGYLNYFAH